LFLDIEVNLVDLRQIGTQVIELFSFVGQVRAEAGGGFNN